MIIRLNGQNFECRSQTVSALLEELNFSHSISPDSISKAKIQPGIAVAVNDTVIPRAQHAEFFLREGDRVEIIRAVQGG